MSDIDWIEGQLREGTKRSRLIRAWHGFWRGLFWGCLVWVASVVIFKLVPIHEQISVWVGLLGALSAFGVAAAAGWRGVSMAEFARFVDSRRGAKERVSTAFEMSRTGGGGGWRDLVVADAVKVLKETDPRKLMPFVVPPIGRWIVLILALGAGLGFVPEYRTAEQKRALLDVANIQDTGRHLVEFAKRNLDVRSPVLENRPKSFEAVQELGEHLAKAKVTRNDALKELAALADRLTQEAKELSKDPALKKLGEQSRSNPGRNGNEAELQKKMDALSRQLGEKAGDPKALAELQRDLEKAREAAAGATPNGGQLDSQAARSMAEKLAELAQQAQALGVPLPDLEKAIEALKRADVDQFLKSLESAEKSLEKMEQMARALESMREEMQTLGKNLGEQLKNAQAQAAIGTLARMRKELEGGGKSDKSRLEMMKELRDALEPAKSYGKVAEHLEAGARKIGEGDLSGGREELAKAAKELENLMAEMAEGESLMASLDALQRAQMAVGNGMSWGQCKASGAARGGKPGKGVGTWADEDSQLADVPEVTERWDNSDVQRQDMDARGVTDRPEDRSSALVPTKVKGQINPGAPMPSITLKGLSVKGQSRVGYTEAIPAAQSQAQSALSQDQVPRAYRGAVRDYFNDLKE